jgi:hypothetical protein
MSLEHVRDLEALRLGQTRSLYKRDGQHVVISTVGDLMAGLNTEQRAIISMGGILAGYATGGEETMAFHPTADGEITDWCEIAGARGPNSRNAVLSDLA